MTTRREIEETLLRGDEIAGIRLDTLEKRQLFAFFLSQSTFPSAPFTDQYIEALKAAYANAAQEAAITSPTPALNIPIGTCRLIRVETRSFGGLNRLDGNTLSLDVHGQGMMIGGYNGKGKTSLASALVWGLTGSRLVSQIGPVESASVPQPLFAPVTANVSESDGAPQAIRSWPPVLAYPRSTRAEDLKGASGAAEVILTFLDDAGKEWSLKRVINAAGTMTFDGLQTLGFTEMLAEIAVLMPNRIPAIRIGEGQSEADALVKLLGLEPLGQLADHVADLHHANKNFSKSPSAADVEKVKKAFEAKIEEVRKKLETIFTSIYANINADDPNGKEEECIRLAE